MTENEFVEIFANLNAEDKKEIKSLIYQAFVSATTQLPFVEPLGEP